MLSLSFFFNDTATPEIYTLSLHDALPIYRCPGSAQWAASGVAMYSHAAARLGWAACGFGLVIWALHFVVWADRKSTRLNSSHRCISYAVFCLKKKNNSLVNELPAVNQSDF